MRIVIALSLVVGMSGPILATELPPASEYVAWASCSGDMKDFCEYARTEFPNDYEKALEGDYQGQRNVAFCLSTGCNGAITERETLGCAWRIVIQASGSPKVDDTDRFNYEVYCRKELDETQYATAREQARTIFREIYGRGLPAGF